MNHAIIITDEEQAFLLTVLDDLTATLTTPETIALIESLKWKVEDKNED